MRVPGGDRRNGDSPRQGIDTLPASHPSRDIIFVEMGIARDRALTHCRSKFHPAKLERVEMGIARDRALTQFKLSYLLYYTFM